MGRTLNIAVWATVGGIVLLAPNAILAQEKPMPTKEIVWPADKIQYKEVVPGASAAVLWGDPATGEYARLTRFAKGIRHKLHTHPNDIHIVVISGTFVYDSGSGMKKLGPGSYLLQPGGVKHVSGAGEDGECLFFEESAGKFDLKFVE